MYFISDVAAALAPVAAFFVAGARVVATVKSIIGAADMIQAVAAILARHEDKWACDAEDFC